MTEVNSLNTGVGLSKHFAPNAVGRRLIRDAGESFGWKPIKNDILAVRHGGRSADHQAGAKSLSTLGSHDLSYRRKLVTAGIGKAACRGGA
jgi:hypothetical protein